MKDISIPLNGISENQTVEIEMRVKGLEKVFLFKIESFPWEASDADKQINSESAKIYQLKKIFRTTTKNGN